MKTQAKVLIAALGAALTGLTLQAQACSTVIVGKDISATGNIIVGHNEDNGGRILTQQHWVPAATHKKGEMIRFEPAAAKIPQVEKTFGFYWSQTFDPTGASFSDGFVNENGVVIVSNACTGIYEDDIMPTKDGGIGYGIRRLMAERATSARHAVDIAIGLLTRYGYFSEGRTYTIADKNEAWQLAIHQGNTWVARRVKDNEIVYIPNNFMMDHVDATDTENVIVAPGMIERAIKNGRYKPAQEGVYNDFNYRVAVAPAERRAAEYNKSRNNLAWNKLIGQNITDPEKFPYSATPNKKYTVEDVKDLLRTHEATIGDDAGWFHHNGFGICRPTTHESAVFELNDNPLLITAWRALARPCETPYVPMYPLAKPAEGAAFMSAEKATAEHFKGTPGLFSYDANWPVWTFVEAANTLDYQRDDMAENTKFVAELEKQMEKSRVAMHARVTNLVKTAPEKAAQDLHNFNVDMFDRARAAVGQHTQKIAPHKIQVLADEVDAKSTKLVDIVLYSDDTLDATKVDLKRTFAGAGRASVGAPVVMSHLAQPKATQARDVDGDGKKDMVFSFAPKELTHELFLGNIYDLWLYTYDGDKRITSFDAVLVDDPESKKIYKRTVGSDL